MKKVFDPQTVAHLWANKAQDEARNSHGNFYFDGDTIYSYGRHFPIAKHLKDGKVLFTTKTYSNTTAKHISVVSGACSHKEKIYAPTIEGNHVANMATWGCAIESDLKAMAKARKKEKYFSSIQATQNEARVYLDYFKVKPSKEFKRLLNYTFEDAQKHAEKAKAEAEKFAKAVNTQGRKLFERYRTMWVEGMRPSDILKELNPTPKQRELSEKYWAAINETLVRVRDGNVETSKGVTIPLDVAKRYAVKFLDGQLSEGEQILHYTVAKVAPDMVSIGCHNISRSDAQMIASK